MSLILILLNNQYLFWSDSKFRYHYSFAIINNINLYFFLLEVLFKNELMKKPNH